MSERSKAAATTLRVLGIVGRTLIGAGVILLLFVAYLVWGTALQQEHTQSQLRTELVHKAHNTQERQALSAPSDPNQLPTGPATIAPTTAGPADGDPVGEIRIPAIGIDQVVVSGTNTDDLRKGPGHYTNTPLPGQAGNAGVAGHRTTYGHPFYNLNVLKPGDPIIFTTVQGVFVYDTTSSQVVSPSDGTVLAAMSGSWVTLTTCNPRFSASTRLVVTAKLVHSKLFDATAPPATATTTTTAPAKGHPGHHAQKGATGQNGALAGNNNGQLLDAVLWGALLAAFGTAVLITAHRLRRYRWYLWGGGTLVALVLLYVFFTAISPLLPASL
jgi:sortase A